jgi:hypothetical protein
MSAFQDRLHPRGGAIAFAAGMAVPVALVSLLFSERWTARAPGEYLVGWCACARRV